MILYTCGARKRGAPMHPCGRAAKALDDAGIAYEIEVVGGYKALPWTRRGKRDEIRRLTGQEDVPVLVGADGLAVAGTGEIVAWAAAQQAS